MSEALQAERDVVRLIRDTWAAIDRKDWEAELLEVEGLFMKLHTRLPAEMNWIRSLIAGALWRSPDHWEMNPDPT